MFVQFCGCPSGCKHAVPASLCPSASQTVCPFAPNILLSVGSLAHNKLFCRLSPHVMRKTMRVYSFNYLGIRLTGHFAQGGGKPVSDWICLYVVHCRLQTAFMLSWLIICSVEALAWIYWRVNFSDFITFMSTIRVLDLFFFIPCMPQDWIEF